MHKLELEISDDRLFDAILEILQSLPADKVRISKIERAEQGSGTFSTYKSYSSYKQQMNEFLDDVLKNLD